MIRNFFYMRQGQDGGKEHSELTSSYRHNKFPDTYGIIFL